MKYALALLALLCSTLLVMAQPAPTNHLIYVTSAPSGSCSAGQALQYVTSGPSVGNLYGCVSGTWTIIAQAGGGATPGGSPTQLQYNNAGAFGGITGATSDGTSLFVTTQSASDSSTKTASTAFVARAIPFTYFSGPQTPVSQTGSNASAYDVTGVPALGAGKCYFIESGLNNDGGAAVAVTFTFYIDSTLMLTGYSGSGVGGQFQFSVLHCNNPGVTNAQTTVGYLAYFGSGGSAVPGTSLSPTWVSTALTIDWSTTHTIHVYTNAAMGNTITPEYVHVVQQ